MELQQKHYLFRGMDGYAGFCHGQGYALMPDAGNDGSGRVTVEMPHASSAGRAAFDAKQWAQWWEKTNKLAVDQQSKLRCTY